MTREELITIGEHKVRTNETLMLSYLKEFEKLFSRKPQCAGCTFKSDWSKFINGNIQTQNNFKMKTDKTFELVGSANSLIHTYRIAKKPYRTYGNRMTEEFANAYLTEGTKEELEARQKYFKKTPKVAKSKVEEIEVKTEKVETPKVHTPKKKFSKKNK